MSTTVERSIEFLKSLGWTGRDAHEIICVEEEREDE